jgi:hypothetical protein
MQRSPGGRRRARIRLRFANSQIVYEYVYRFAEYEYMYRFAEYEYDAAPAARGRDG